MDSFHGHGDCQGHQIPWGSPGEEPHPGPQHQLHSHKNPAVSLLSEKLLISHRPSLPHFTEGLLRASWAAASLPGLETALSLISKTLRWIERIAEEAIRVSLPSSTDHQPPALWETTRTPDTNSLPLCCDKSYQSIDRLTARLCDSFFPKPTDSSIPRDGTDTTSPIATKTPWTKYCIDYLHFCHNTR